MLLTLGIFFVSGKAAFAKDQTYTQPFQNQTVTLSGNAVQTNMYFVKMGYWNVKQATLNLNFQVSQLSDKQISDITVSVNNVKFYSFRPKRVSGIQTKKINIPTRLLSGENNIEVSGQILNKGGHKNYQLAQTPANWLTIYKNANINFKYQLVPPTKSVKSFYGHFTGADTIVNRNAVITTPSQPTNNELAAGMYALCGQSRIITTETDQIPVTTFNDSQAKKAAYQVVIATYDHLPANIKKMVAKNDVANQAVIKTHDTKTKHLLIVTAKNGALLKKAAKYIANQELMKETSQATKVITQDTPTYTSVLQYDGSAQLTKQDSQIVGANHQEQAYFVSSPVDRDNADGSEVRLHFRYAKNLNFKRSMVTVLINNRPIGSKKLTAKHANDDELTVKFPAGQSLGNEFTVRVAFDLDIDDQSKANNNQTPWATVSSNSKAIIKSQPKNSLLFSNYPGVFIKNQTFDNLMVVRPKTMTGPDFQTLSNIFNLIGNYAQSNTGKVTFVGHRPSRDQLKRSSVIAFGAPKQNPFIKSLNPQLYFQFGNHFSSLVSNEKLSIEHQYGKTVGTAQLLRSLFNKRRALLVITGATPTAAVLGSTQLNFQKNIEMYRNQDGLLVDPDNNHFSYRFKKQAAIEPGKTVQQRFSQNSRILIYLAVALLFLIIIGIAIVALLRKNGLLNRKGEQNE